MREELISVGIDVGTTTTQVIFSRLVLENRGRAGTLPDARITDKEILYRSAIHFTPLASADRIDTAALRNIVMEEYTRSGMKKGDISAGAVIITGETARKQNAADVLNSMSGFAGDFVVGTAGPDLEAILAGWGAGAGELSKTVTGRIVNFDIGGGTTNAAVFFNGEIQDAFALDIGGRLIRLDKGGRITYISARLIPVLQRLGMDITVGRRPSFTDLERICIRLADMFSALIKPMEPEEDMRSLFIGHGQKGLAVDGIMFSGGVAEFIYSDDRVDTLDKAAEYGDIGPLLGYCIRRRMAEENIHLLVPKEKIRATVIGAGNHSLHVSGSTVDWADTLLPMKNIPVIRLFGEKEEEAVSTIGTRILEKRALYPEDTPAIAFQGPKSPSYRELTVMAGEIAYGTNGMEGPLIILVEHDFAKALGQTLRSRIGSRPVICLDRIRAEDGNYIDLGKPTAGIIPVVIKTLLFHC